MKIFCFQLRMACRRFCGKKVRIQPRSKSPAQVPVIKQATKFGRRKKRFAIIEKVLANKPNKRIGFIFLCIKSPQVLFE